MLSRTADHLFWMARYTERAENTARMLDVNYQTSLLPQSAAVAQLGWQGLLSISELVPAYTQRHGEIEASRVMDFMVKDPNNPSSILSCLRAARENARAVRGSLTTETWETQNHTWLEINLLILRPDMPRSLHASMNEVVSNLNLVGNEQSSETLRRAGRLRAELQYGSIDEILATGLHAFLTQFLDRVNELGMRISRDFLVPATL
jgi:uncharacterized alpha-E superfamily protein